jgi:hypothetical protein
MHLVNFEECHTRVLREALGEKAKTWKRETCIEYLHSCGTHHMLSSCPPKKDVTHVCDSTRMKDRYPLKYNKRKKLLSCSRELTPLSSQNHIQDFSPTIEDEGTLTKAFVHKSLYSKKIKIGETDLGLSIHQVQDVILKMQEMVRGVTSNIEELNNYTKNILYNNHFETEVIPFKPVFESIHNPGLMLNKGFGVLEHTPGNYVEEGGIDYWEYMYIDFSAPFSDNVVSAIEVTNSNGGDVVYELSPFTSSEDTVAFSIIVALHDTKGLTITLVHSSEVLPDWKVIINKVNGNIYTNEIEYAATINGNRLSFAPIKEIIPEVSEQRVLLHGNVVDWKCKLRFTEESVGYSFPFEQIKLRLPFRARELKSNDNPHLKNKYSPLRALLRYKYVNSSEQRMISVLAHIDNKSPDFIFVEFLSKQNYSLKEVEIHIHATYVVADESLHYFTPMRYDQENESYLTPLDVVHHNDFAFSQGFMKWSYTENQVSLTCNVTLWQLNTVNATSGKFFLKLPVGADTQSPRFSGTGSIIVNDDILGQKPIVCIDTTNSLHDLENYNIDEIHNNMNPSSHFLCVQFQETNLLRFTEAKLVQFALHINYYVDRIRLKRDDPVLSFNKTTTTHLSLTNIHFSNAINAISNERAIENTHQMTISIQKHII